MVRDKNWKFPRWGGYNKGRDAAQVRLCDHDGCGKRGDSPAPKAKFSEEKWWFCQEHAAEYNRGWNFFAGMSDREKERAAQEDEHIRRGYKNNANPWGWASPSESPEQRKRRQALEVLGLDDEASPDDIKRRFRQLAKESHPDANPGCKEAEDRFKRICAANDLLSQKRSA
ncbi:MAG: J domain-containing protein [Sphingomonadales bacterium]